MMFIVFGNLVKKITKGFSYSYLNGNETQETEEKGTLPFLDMKITKNDHKIQIGIYRKEAHTLKYSSYDSYRPRNEQIGI